MAKALLTARWTDLVMITWEVARELVVPHVPRGLGVDVLPGMSGESALVSLVAFDFCGLRWKGIAPPGCGRFAEINLRTYVRGGDGEEGKERGARGVVFLREFAPGRLVCWGAKRWYNEPYLRRRTESRVESGAERIEVEHRLWWDVGAVQRIRVVGRKPAVAVGRESAEHWLKEHEWGFGRTRRGETVWYRVEHPEWAVYPVEGWELDFDFGRVYGEEWAFLRGERARNVLFAAGSGVAVYPKRKLE